MKCLLHPAAPSSPAENFGLHPGLICVTMTAVPPWLSVAHAVLFLDVKAAPASLFAVRKITAGRRRARLPVAIKNEYKYKM